MGRTLQRTRAELAAFLRSRRERISPEQAGLPAGGRRRTPGLRREEVAALAGVGLTWYTWLEQGRDIGVSTAFLDSVCRVLKLDATERRHLYLLTYQRAPAEQAQTWCVVPPVIHRMMADMPLRPAYVLNRRWDVLAWNAAADKVFDFAARPPEQRNLLWLLFTDERMRSLLCPWQEQAIQLLCAFRLGFAHASAQSDVGELVRSLEKVSAEFKDWWHRNDIHGSSHGIRHLNIESVGRVPFEQATLTIDTNRHLHLVYYAPDPQSPEQSRFDAWLQG